MSKQFPTYPHTAGVTVHCASCNKPAKEVEAYFAAKSRSLEVHAACHGSKAHTSIPLNTLCEKRHPLAHVVMFKNDKHRRDHKKRVKKVRAYKKHGWKL